jgi:tRNA-specific 2-thiouridylase
MKNYVDESNPHCQTRQDRDMALQVAQHLGITTFIIFDFRQQYQETIVHYIIQGYESGITPNPDILCNSEIKFKLFLDRALDLGCQYIATGHYAQITYTDV